MNSVKNLGSMALSKITPECVNVGRSIKLTSIFSMCLVLVCLIFLISVIIYNYIKKTDSTDADIQKENEDKKRKVQGGILITTTVTLALTLLVSVWGVSVVSKAANRCIKVD